MYQKKKFFVMLSTVLFMEEKPVGYTITIKNNKYIFRPSEHSHANLSAPVFYAFLENETWKMKGIYDEKVIEQAKIALEAAVKNDDMELSAAV